MGVVRAGNFKTVGLSNAQIVDGSLKFDSTKTQHLKRTPSSTGNRRTWTFSCWYRALKRGTGANGYRAFFGSLNTYINHSGAGGGATENDLYWNLRDAGTNYFGEFAELFRDPGAWYHIVWSVDTTQSTSSNRAKLYVNNVALGAAGAGPNGISYPPQSTETPVNAASNVHYIGANDGASNPMEGQLTQVYLIDGYALDPSYFGFTDPLTNTWRPKKYKTSIDTYVNNGTVWSNSWGATGSTGNVDNGANAFNGNLSNYASNQNSNTTVVWQPSSPIPVRRTLRVYAAAISSGSGQVAVNGTDLGTIPSSTPQWWTIRGATQLEKISLTDTGSTHGRLYAVEVDGVILVNSSTSNSLVDNYFFGTNGFYLPFDGNSLIGQDQSGRGSDWTPVNFGGSNTIEKATGAFPILNTDGGGKVARVGVRTDSNASSLVLALPLVGIKSDFSNAINSGTSNKAITVNGDAAASSIQSNFYGGSFAFDGSGDYLSIPDNADFAFGSGDFTIESWVYINDLSSTRTISGQNNSGGGGSSYGHFLEVLSDGSVNAGGFEPGVNYINVTTPTGRVTTGKWYHIAMVRNGNNLIIYVDGINQASLDITGKSFTDSSNLFAIGRPGEYNGYYMNGYIQDYRIYKGVAKYTSNFIPASSDPDILPDTPSGVAYSSTLSLPTSNEGGSLLFDGSGDYLRFSQSSDWAFGTGDFSIEYFIFPNYTTNTLGFGGTRGAAGTSAGWNIGLINEDSVSGYIQMYSDGGIAPTNAHRKILYRKWTHVVYTRSGSTIRAIIDGVLHNTASNSQNWTLNDFSIGITGAGAAEPYLGFLSNIRIIKGSIPTSYQTSSTTLGTKIFDVPTSPLTTTSQGATSGDVKFLGCNSLTAITDFTVTPNTPTVNGSVSVSNFNPFTTNTNAVRGQESGYCTWNPLDNAGTLSNGNLNFSNGASNASVRSTFALPNSGKFYAEAITGSLSSGSSGVSFGFATSTLSLTASPLNTGNYTIYSDNIGRLIVNGTAISTSLGTFAAGTLLQIAYDGSTGKGWFGKENIWYDSSGGTSGNPSLGLNPTFTTTSTLFLYSLCVSNSVAANFGQKPFKFPPPAGFQPLALANTPRPTIVRPDQYVGIVTYSGQTAAQSITTGFKPDLVWIKRRNSAENNLLFDSIRGPLNRLISNATNAELSLANSLTSFNSNGFSLGSGESAVNADTYTYVAWCWKAGGSGGGYSFWKDDIGYSTASAAGLTAGTITPTGASVNTKSGFSIIGYNGAGTNSALTSTISHGLTQAPTFMIVKARTGTNAADDWFVYHKSIGPTKRIRLNLTNAPDTQTWMGDTEPTSSLITLNQGWYSVNYTGHTHILYAWHDVPGFSKFGSYTGNNSTDGPVVITGFKPAFVLIRQARTDATGRDWMIFDNKRSVQYGAGGFNAISTYLYPNYNLAEASAASIDFLSNGFKIRASDSTNNNINGSGQNHIYAAFAEAPSFNLYGGQSNAR